MPKQDIIPTKLGLLIKPLPLRPEALNEQQKDQLDVLTTDYVIAGDKKKEAEDKVITAFPGVSKDILTKYLKDYEASTRALSQSVLDIASKKYEFDSQAIADYTKDNYSQPIIREKLIHVFREAKALFLKNNK